MQHADAKFERALPREWKGIPWECSEADSLPTLPEAILWAACALLIVLLFSMAMGADVFKILRLVVT
jgi:hypothetical protein